MPNPITEHVRLGLSSGDPGTLLRFTAVASLSAPGKNEKFYIAGALNVPTATLQRRLRSGA